MGRTSFPLPLTHLVGRNRDIALLRQWIADPTAAALELARSGEREEANEGLVRYCTSEASLAASGLVGPDQAEWLDRVGEDLESYRGALTWLIDRDRAAEAVHIAWSLLFF